LNDQINQLSDHLTKKIDDVEAEISKLLSNVFPTRRSSTVSDEDFISQIDRANILNAQVSVVLLLNCHLKIFRWLSFNVS
jgi:hypothetical protein